MRWLLVLCLACSACTTAKKQHAHAKPVVLSTVAMIHDVVKTIGGEEIDAKTLICGDLDPHTYELVKGDSEKFQAASLIFCNGLGLEHGLSLRKELENNPKAIALAEKILEKDAAAIVSCDGKYDPHIWLDVSLWMQIIEPVKEALSQLDPSHSALFQERADALYAEMERADQLFFTTLQNLPEDKRYLVTCHDAFHYFSRRYLATSEERENQKWKERSAAPEGLAPDAELSLQDISFLVTYIQKHAISVVFSEANLNKDSLRKIVTVAAEKGACIRLASGPLYADSIGEANSYLEMMAHNVGIIEKELN